MKCIETVYFLNTLLTLFFVGIISLMVKNEMRTRGDVGLFVYIYSAICAGLIILLWYGMYCLVANGELNWYGM